MRQHPAAVVVGFFVLNLTVLSIHLQDAFEGSKPLTPFRSFDNLTQREIVRPPVRSRSVLSAFFVKQKTPKLRTGA